MENKDAKILECFQACLKGVAVGDAIGMPWEIMTRAEIMAETNGVGVTGFSEPKERRALRFALGRTTDDWALTSAIARSLIHLKRFDLCDIALRHIRELEIEKGWGGTTRDAVMAVKEYFDSRGESGRSPLNPLPIIMGTTGAGNGVAIKVAPLALWQAVRKDSRETFYGRILGLGLMTHPNPIASVTACVFAELMATVCQKPIMSDLDMYQCVWHVVEMLYQFLPHATVLNEVRVMVTDRLGEILEHRWDVDNSWLREKIGVNCFSLESVLFSIGTFLRHPRDFRTAVLEAINAGGDTDSTASMVGALVGANCGLWDENRNSIIPLEWQNFGPDFASALSIGEELYIMAKIGR